MDKTKTNENERTTPEYGDVRLSDVDKEKAYAAASRITAEIEKVIVGKSKEVRLAVTALLSGTHVLIEDVPGVGKTTLAAALARATGLEFRRAQFTPDVTASDITGFNIYNRSTERFEFTRGLVMTNVLLADEINRASPKTQSALLEAMEEGRVTVDGKTYDVPEPYIVIATQNPAGFVGTYPLPEAQLDRFGIKMSLGYPTLEEEIGIVESRGGEDPISRIKPAVSAPLLIFLQRLVSDVYIDSEVYRYIVSLVAATRTHKAVALGASPRASITLKRLCQAYAFMNSRDYVIPEDVYAVFGAAVAHRLTLNRDAKIRSLSCDTVTKEILHSVKIPYKGSR